LDYIKQGKRGFIVSKKKKRIIIIIVAVVILLFPFIPYGIKDGGSYGFYAISYELRFNRAMERGKSVTIKPFHIFEINIKGL